MEALQKKVLVIGGPTGGGKDTIVLALLKEHPQFVRLVTATTRPPRVYEEHERDYYFLTNEEFKTALEMGDILEHTYFENRNEYYGTYKPDLEKKITEGKIVIAVTDRVGAMYMKEHYGATTVSIIPIPFQSLHERFRSREPDVSEEWIARRMENAKEEIELGKNCFDYEVENIYGQLGHTLVRVDDILTKEGYLK